MINEMNQYIIYFGGLLTIGICIISGSLIWLVNSHKIVKE